MKNVSARPFPVDFECESKSASFVREAIVGGGSVRDITGCISSPADEAFGATLRDESSKLLAFFIIVSSFLFDAVISTIGVDTEFPAVHVAINVDGVAGHERIE